MSWEPDYITQDEFKAFARISDDLDNIHIDRAITSGSRSIDKYASCRKNGLGFRRQFGLCAAPEPHFYTARWDAQQAKYVVEIDDLMTEIGLVVEFDMDNDDTYETTCTDFVLRPRDAVSRALPYTQIAINNTSAVQPSTSFVDNVKITARWGWTTVPVAIQQATLLQSHRIFKRRQSPLGVQGSNSAGSGSSETMVENDLDPDAMRLVDTRYRRLARTP